MLIKKIKFFPLVLILLLSIVSCDGHCNPRSPVVFDTSFLQPSSNKLFYIVAVGAGINSEKQNGTWFQEKIFFDVSGTEPIIEKKVNFIGSYTEDYRIKNWHTFTKLFDKGDVIGEVISTFGVKNTNFLLNIKTGDKLTLDFDLLSYIDDSYTEPVSFNTDVGYKWWAFLLYKVQNQLFATRVVGNPVIIRNKQFHNFSLIRVDKELRYIAFQNGRYEIGDFIFNPETGSYKFSDAVTYVNIDEPVKTTFYSNGYYFFVGKENLFYTKLDDETEEIPLPYDDNVEICGVQAGKDGFWMLGCGGIKASGAMEVKKVYFVTWGKNKFSVSIPNGDSSLFYGMAYVIDNSLYFGYNEIPFKYKYDGVDFFSISDNRNLVKFEFDPDNNRVLVRQIISDTYLKDVLDSFVKEILKKKQ